MPLGFARNAGLLAGGGGAFDHTASGHMTNWTSASYQFYRWTSSGSIEFENAPAGATLDMILVGGGGGSYQPMGSQGHGGSGAGGCRYLTGLNLVDGTHSVIVGAGGTYSQGSNSYVPAAWNKSSYWSPSSGVIYAAGGGYGSAYPYSSSTSGGSGGGGDGPWPSGAGGNSPSVSPSQGNTGGNGSYNQYGYYGGGGGGGAGGTGYPCIYNGTYMAGATQGWGGSGVAYTSFRDSAGPSGDGYDYFAGGGGAYFTPGWVSQTNSPAGGAYQSSGTAGTGAGSAGGPSSYFGGGGCIILRWDINY
jgi:hypothetical protein